MDSRLVFLRPLGLRLLGFIAWKTWYVPYATARANLGMKPEDPGPIKDKKVRQQLKDKYWTIIDDGIKNLQKSLEIDKNYDDAMAYLNLLHKSDRSHVVL